MRFLRQLSRIHSFTCAVIQPFSSTPTIHRFNRPNPYNTMTEPPSSSEQPSATTSTLKSTDGIGRIGNAVRYSLQGLTHAIRCEAAFRQELMIAVPAMIGLWFLPLSIVEKIVLLGTVLLVLIIELLNSAIEATVDRVSTERHPLSGRAKDLGSAAVFLAVTLMTLAWIMLAGPVVVRLFAAMF